MLPSSGRCPPPPGPQEEAVPGAFNQCSAAGCPGLPRRHEGQTDGQRDGQKGSARGTHCPHAPRPAAAATNTGSRVKEPVHVGKRGLKKKKKGRKQQKPQNWAKGEAVPLPIPSPPRPLPARRCPAR